MILRRDFFRRLLGSFALAALVPAWAHAKPKTSSRRAAAPSPTPSATPDASPAPAKSPTRLRLWKACDAPDQKLQIRLLPHGKPDSEAVSPLSVDTVGYQFTEYAEVPAGPMTAEISIPGQPHPTLLPLNLADGGQSTLLVRKQGESLGAEWIDDAPGSADHGYEFHVYNLLPASGDIQVGLGDILNVRLHSARSSLRLAGIKRAVYPVTIDGTDDGGKNFRWNTEADFRQCRRATLLIYPDPYGRVRPRINMI